jgi:nicotinamide-nucleotide adenylyltransferase
MAILTVPKRPHVQGDEDILACPRSRDSFSPLMRRETRRDRVIDDLQRKVKAFRAIRSPSILFIRKAPRGISSKERLGIFPASFNPPTKAHMALVREARKQYDLDEVLVLLDLQAMDKRIFGASLAHRLMMLNLLFRRDPRISIGLSNRGLFLEKIKALRKLFPSAVTIYFIVGFDTILRVMNKRYYKNRKKSLDSLFEACQFLVANRGTHEKEAFERFFRVGANQKYKERVSFFTLPRKMSSLSSSHVRNRIKERKPVGDLLSSSIRMYIEKTGFYTK